MMVRSLLTSFVFVIALAAVSGAQQRPEQQDEFVPVTGVPESEQLPSAPLVIAAYAFAWVAIGGYVVSVAKRLTTVQHEIERLETDSRRSR